MWVRGLKSGFHLAGGLIPKPSSALVLKVLNKFFRLKLSTKFFIHFKAPDDISEFSGSWPFDSGGLLSRLSKCASWYFWLHTLVLVFGRKLSSCLSTDSG